MPVTTSITRFPLTLNLAAFCLASHLPSNSLAEPINRHYAEPVLVLPRGPDVISMDHWGVGDVTGDGLDDVVYTGSFDVDDNNQNIQDAILIIMSRSEDGLLENVVPDLIGGPAPRMADIGARKLVFEDFNNDGVTDLYLSSPGAEIFCENFGQDHHECWPGGQNRLILSDGPGKMTDVTDTHLPQLNDFTHGAVAADFDGDGDIDIFANNFQLHENNTEVSTHWAYFLFNDGDGKFEVAADNSAGRPDPIAGSNGRWPDNERMGGFWPTAVDAEGDGDNDLYLGFNGIREACPDPNCEHVADMNILLLNDGTGRFERRQEDPVVNPKLAYAWPQGSMTHDFNEDGLQDMLIHQTPLDYHGPNLGWDVFWDEAELQLLISNGDGSFRDETLARFPDGAPKGQPAYAGHWELHDMDGDGHQDFFGHVVLSGGYPDIRINNGEGVFRALGKEWALAVGPNFAPLDVDGDGGTDFYSESFDGWVVHKMVMPYGAELDGTSEDDRLIGGAWDNVYRGLEGDDVLDGGLGDDTLDGGPGNDTLIGGKGDDIYVFHAADLASDDTISDKAGFDRLKFDGFSLASVSQARQDEDGNLVLDFTSGGSLTVKDHFDGGNDGIEYLEAGGSVMPLSRDPSFTSGNIQSLLLDDFFINAGLNDAWVSDGTPYQGMFLTVFPLLKLVFAAWFTFDSKLPPQPFTATFGADDQRWVTGLGTYEDNRAELNMELTTGGRFNSNTPLATQDDTFGTMIIEFTDCTLASVEYEFPAAGESGFMTVSRVVDSNVPLCEKLNTP